jgi:hypothetical protein
MAYNNAPLLALTGGEVSTNALARVDLERMRLSAELQRNWMPRALGPMMMRPGLEYVGTTKGNARAKFFPFIYSASDKAAFEFSDAVLRIWRGTPLAPIQRGSVSTAFTNGNFASGTGWNTQTAGGGAVSYATNLLTLSAPGRGGYSRTYQALTVSVGDQGDPHGHRIRILNGPVLLRIGSTIGGQEYIRETPLETGYHSLEFTPTGGTYYVQFENRDQRDKTVHSISVEAAGVVEITSPYALANLSSIRVAQTGDLVYLACEGLKPHVIERRSQTSFSLVEFRPADGPFSKARTAKVRLKPSVAEGNGTLRSDFNFFTPGHVGAIFELFHEGYGTTFRLGAEQTFTDPIRVTGTSGDSHNDRNWSYIISGTWSGTLRVSRSFDDEDAGYKDFRRQDNSSTIPITSNMSAVNVDSDQNTIAFYRIGFNSGSYTSGVASIQMTYDGGGGTGRCRVTGYTSPTQVSMEVLEPFTNVNYTDDWKEGTWSDVQGWPSAVGLSEGRVFWGLQEQLVGSVSDIADSYDIDIEGDSASIQRTVSTGAIDRINWILGLQRLVVGTDGSENTIRSSSLDEPLTPTAFTVREASTQGSVSNVPALKVDTFGVYVQKSNARVYRLAYSSDVQDYASQDLTKLNDQILNMGVVAMAAQRQPDTRIHVIRTDGKAAVFLTDFIEEVDCWVTVETDGVVEDVFVLPGQVEDEVYYVVNRAINGGTVRYVEKWALESEAVNGAVNKIADSCITYTGVATTSIPAAHLEGADVVVWANGACLADGLTDSQGNITKPLMTVAGGVVTLANAATNVTVGLPYKARYKSTKLAYGGTLGTALLQRKRIVSIGFILADAHIDALRYGPDFNTLDPMRGVELDETQPDNMVYGTYDADAAIGPGGWGTDSRICLEANAPYGVKVLGVVVGLTTAERT